MADTKRSVGSKYFELRVPVALKFHSRIIGSNLRQLQSETNTEIIVPQDSRDRNFVIKGSTEENVLAAKQRIDDITNANDQEPSVKMTLSHFLSVSCANDEVKKNFERFKCEVLSDPESRMLYESFFPSPEKLHVTITMLALNRGSQNEALAFQYLKECKEKFIDPVLQGKPLRVKVTGVGVFSDCKPSAVNVVFAKVESSELQQISNKIAKYYESRRLIRLDHEQVKLHLTLINTYLYKHNVDSGEAAEDKIINEKQIKRKRFNAKRILEKFKDFHFGSVVVDEIHISRLFVKVQNGYYDSAGILKL